MEQYVTYGTWEVVEVTVKKVERVAHRSTCEGRGKLAQGLADLQDLVVGNHLEEALLWVGEDLMRGSRMHVSSLM